MTIHSASGSVRIAAAKVVSITEIAGDAPAATGRLNVVPGDAADHPESGAGEGARPTAAGPAARGDAWMRVPETHEPMRRGDFAAAERAARQAALARPDDAAPRIAIGELLLAQARHGDAAALLAAVPLSGLEGGLRRARDLALAEALSRLQRVDEARRVLEQSPADDTGRIARALAQLEPDFELSERPFGSSAHFVLVGPPGSRPRDIDALLEILEEIHAEIARELGGAPRDRITVLLHPGTEFWESTGMGAEVAALYDGRMRIPAGRVTSVTPALRGALRHEMAHAFVEALSGGRADTRWHEGIAEHFEGSDARPVTEQLRAVARRAGGDWPPPVTHATSHARFAWFLGRWGMAGAREVLAAMVSRGTIDQAVRSVTGLGESELDAAWRRDLAAEKP